MIIEIKPTNDFYIVSTDSLDNPGDQINLAVEVNATIESIVKTLNEMRGRPK